MEELLKILPELSDEAKAELEKALLSRYKQGKSDQAKEQEKVDFDLALSKALESAGAIDTAVSRSVMDLDNVLYEKGEFLGLTEEIERIKKEYAFMFHQDCPHFSAGMNGDGDVRLGELNYMERLKLYHENPELYRMQVSR